MRLLLICLLFIFSLSAQPLLFPKKATKLYGFVNAEGDWKIKPQFERATTFKAAFSLVRSNGLWGMIDEDGDYRIRPLYQSLQHIASGLILAQNQQGLYGYLDNQGLEVIEPQFERAYSFIGRTARVQKKGKWNLINRQGEPLLKEAVEAIKSLTKGRFLLRDKSLYGLANNKGQVLLPLAYRQIKTLSPELMLLTNPENARKIYELKTEEVADYQEVKILAKKRLIFVKQKQKWGIINYRGNSITRPMIDQIFPYQEQKALFRIGATHGFLDQRGKITIAPNYTKAQDFDGGKALVQEDKKWFFIDSKGQKIEDQKKETVAKTVKKKRKKKVRRDDDDKEEYRRRIRSYTTRYSWPYYSYSSSPYYRSYCPPKPSPKYYNGVHISTNIGPVRVHYHRSAPIKIRIK